MNVHVYGLYLARSGARIAARCREYGVTDDGPILLVMGCTEGPHQLASAVADWGERPLTVDTKTGRLSGVVKLAADKLVAAGTAHPNELLAKDSSGLPPSIGPDGKRTIVWANLSHPVPVQVGNPRARVS